VGDVRQDVAAQQAAAAVAMRCGDDVGDAVAHAETGQRQRFVERGGAVIDAGEDGAVEVEHRIISLRSPDSTPVRDGTPCDRRYRNFTLSDSSMARRSLRVLPAASKSIAGWNGRLPPAITQTT
jgi:hypothetical protein